MYEQGTTRKFPHNVDISLMSFTFDHSGQVAVLSVEVNIQGNHKVNLMVSVKRS